MTFYQHKLKLTRFQSNSEEQNSSTEFHSEQNVSFASATPVSNHEVDRETELFDRLQVFLVCQQRLEGQL